MRRSQFRNRSALFGCCCCLFIHLVSVSAVDRLYQESSPFFCEVNGKFYREGERFASTSNPELTCQCQRGYTGRDVEPICRRAEPRVEPTNDYFNKTNEKPLMNKCVDIVKHRESPKYSHYTEQQRCTNDAATVPIIVTDNLQRTKDGRLICSFGNIKLGIGDFFYHSMNDDPDNCVKCTCQNPPMPMCFRPRTCPMVNIHNG